MHAFKKRGYFPLEKHCSPKSTEAQNGQNAVDVKAASQIQTEVNIFDLCVLETDSEVEQNTTFPICVTLSNKEWERDCLELKEDKGWVMGPGKRQNQSGAMQKSYLTGSLKRSEKVKINSGIAQMMNVAKELF